MKKLLLTITGLVLMLATTYGQISVSGSVGVNGTYTSLTNAGGVFDALNGTAQTGASITILVTGDVTTEAGTYGLNAGDWNSVTISPSGNRTISGAVAGPLILLNGAGHVTIDGLNTSGNSLTISNTSTISSSTIKFMADASNNTVRNCTLLGSSTSLGVVFFYTGTTTGNDGNNINHCNIGPAGSNYPIYGIYSLGTSASVDNSGNTVNANNIYDYFNASVSSAGMNINSFNSNWTITSNKLYQTTTKTYVASSATYHYGIYITSGAGNTISSNTIGFANPNGTGTTNLIGLNGGSVGGTFPSSYTVTGTLGKIHYVAIYGGFTAGGAMNEIQSNTISGFALLTSESTSSGYGIFCGIGVPSGNVNIGTTGGNMIGGFGGTIYTACSSSAGMIAGIYVITANNATIQNNVMQNIDAMGTTTSTAGSIFGINTEGTLGNITVSNNMIGNYSSTNLRMGNLTTGGNLSNIGTTFGLATGTALFQGIRNANTGNVVIGPNNILQNLSLNSSGSLALLRGIYVTTGTYTISTNTVTNMTSAGAGTSYSSGGLATIGILVGGGTYTITNNIISNLAMMNTGTGGYTLGGIVIAGAASSLNITKNKIWGLANASNSVSVTAPGTTTGIFIRETNGVTANINNNMITLGIGQAANTMYAGIWAQYSTSNPAILKIYYNSIDIEGTVTTGAQPSFGFLRGDLSTSANTVWTIDAKNNLINNTRSGGTGKHYAIANDYGATASATGWGAGASNNNILNANPATVGYWSGDKTLATWVDVSTCDNFSFSNAPVIFTNSATGDLHLNMMNMDTPIESGGAILSVTDDFDNDPRYPNLGYPNHPHHPATATDIGADEYAGGSLAPVSLNLSSVLLEGLYDADGIMRKVQDGEGDHFPGTTAEQIRVELHTTSDYTLEYFQEGVNLATDGTALISIPGTYTGNHYLTIKQKNSIETTSADFVDFSPLSVSYSFAPATQAYSGNMKLSTDGYPMIYTGDVTQEGLVDSDDLAAIANLAAYATTGYLAEDLSGDGLVDSDDLSLAGNNAAWAIGAALPY
jgi:hypothetical protein